MIEIVKPRSPERGTHMKIRNETRQNCRVSFFDFPHYFNTSQQIEILT
ncbi:MAG: hypothetical protein KIH06_02965 [Kiritimatiellae bacterium]|nr:hypothetical protein [Kiritimatiellia bacterium]